MLGGRVLGARKGVKAATALLSLAFAACVGPGKLHPVGDPTGPHGFRAIDRRSEAFATPEELHATEPPESGVYEIGRGDHLTVNVFGHPDLSGAHVVGPDGRITLNVAGPVQVAGQSSEQAASTIGGALGRYYRDAVATVRIDQFNSNEVLVLGRVAAPGPVVFRKQPNLLDALARVGALPTNGAGATNATLTRCAVFRGRDQVFWIDLSKLLSGMSSAYNVRLERDDVVYIPDANDQLVYVLGQVHRPGAFQLTPDMSFMDAISLAGGPTNDASYDSVGLIRPQSGLETQVNLAEIFEGDDRQNASLKEGDIIYVPMHGLAQVGYVLQQISPATNFMSILTAATVK
jgi:polysaccharide export outer membrane protein